MVVAAQADASAQLLLQALAEAIRSAIKAEAPRRTVACVAAATASALFLGGGRLVGRDRGRTPVVEDAPDPAGARRRRRKKRRPTPKPEGPGAPSGPFPANQAREPSECKPEPEGPDAALVPLPEGTVASVAESASAAALAVPAFSFAGPSTVETDTFDKPMSDDQCSEGESVYTSSVGSTVPEDSIPPDALRYCRAVKKQYKRKRVRIRDVEGDHPVDGFKWTSKGILLYRVCGRWFRTDLDYSDSECEFVDGVQPSPVSFEAFRKVISKMKKAGKASKPD